MAYAVRTEVFEGPLDVLLRLIMQEEIDLYELSISGLVDAYLAEIDRLGAIDLETATGFLLIAATLVELKSRRLLPGAGPDEAIDDDLAPFEQRDLLLARLLECKTFKDVAAAFARCIAAAGRSHPRTAGIEEQFLSVAPDLLAGVGPERLRDAFLVAVAAPPRPPAVDLDHVAPIRASVRDAVEELCRLLPGAGAVTFRELAAGAGGRLEVIVRFLAVLELYKQGTVELEQICTFGRLEVRWTAGDDIVAAGVDAYDGEG